MKKFKKKQEVVLVAKDVKNFTNLKNEGLIKLVSWNTESFKFKITTKGQCYLRNIRENRIEKVVGAIARFLGLFTTVLILSYFFTGFFVKRMLG